MYCWTSVDVVVGHEGLEACWRRALCVAPVERRALQTFLPCFAELVTSTHVALEAGLAVVDLLERDRRSAAPVSVARVVRRGGRVMPVVAVVLRRRRWGRRCFAARGRAQQPISLKRSITAAVAGVERTTASRRARSVLATTSHASVPPLHRDRSPAGPSGSRATTVARDGHGERRSDRLAARERRRTRARRCSGVGVVEQQLGEPPSASTDDHARSDHGDAADLLREACHVAARKLLAAVAPAERRGVGAHGRVAARALGRARERAKRWLPRLRRLRSAHTDPFMLLAPAREELPQERIYQRGSGALDGSARSTRCSRPRRRPAGPSAGGAAARRRTRRRRRGGPPGAAPAR